MTDKEELPRRNRLDQMTPAELAIWDATRRVEEAGAAPALTDAVVLLGRARDRVADFVDGIEEPSNETRLEHVCHPDQMVIWSGEVLSHIVDQLSADLDSEDVIHLHTSIQREIKRIVAIVLEA